MVGMETTFIGKFIQRLHDMVAFASTLERTKALIDLSARDARTVSTSRQVKRPRGGLGRSEDRSVPEPTTAMPGTKAKLQVMMQRAELGQHLFHPEDPTFYR